MTNKHSFVAVIILLFSLNITPQDANATGFLPQDARAMAMGGAGVAVGNSRQAHYYNPSLLINAPADEDFNFEVDAAIRISDSDKLLQATKDIFEDKPYDRLNAASQAYDNTPTPTNAQELIDAIDVTLNSIRSVGNKSLTLDANAGVFTSVPNKKISWAVYFNAWANSGQQGNFKQADLDLLDGFQNIAEDYLANTPINPQTIQFNEESLTSSYSVQGALVAEFGIALAMNQSINNYEFDLGITPKIQHVVTFGDELLFFEAENEENEFGTNPNTLETTTFNFDIGVSKKLSDNWKTGVVIKNLIPRSYDIKAVNQDAKIAPSTRIGVAYVSNWINAGIDLDLTENDDIASHTSTQFLALGLEADVWLLKLRGGYRHNFASSGGSGPSVGLGLYLLGLNVDLAVASNTIKPEDFSEDSTAVNNINASAQLGFNW